MRSIISKAVLSTVVMACLSIGSHAKPLSHVSTIIAVSDTGKMDKMSKMDKKKMSKMSHNKMSHDKMKMSKEKMAKDTSGKM